MKPFMTTIITHWFPIITLCPVNNLPDPIYIEVKCHDKFVELYAVRKLLRKKFAWRTLFMEDVAQEVLKEIPEASEVTVRLWFNKHTVKLLR
jgi:hypothetical protein